MLYKFNMFKGMKVIVEGGLFVGYNKLDFFFLDLK